MKKMLYKHINVNPQLNIHHSIVKSVKITHRWKIIMNTLPRKQSLWKFYHEPSTHHFDDLRVRRLGEHRPGGRDVVDELVETGTLYLLALQVRDRVHEVEHNAALLELLDEQILLFRGGRVCNREYRGQAEVFIQRWVSHLYTEVRRTSLHIGQAAIFIQRSGGHLYTEVRQPSLYITSVGHLYTEVRWPSLYRDQAAIFIYYISRPSLYRGQVAIFIQRSGSHLYILHQSAIFIQRSGGHLYTEVRRLSLYVTSVGHLYTEVRRPSLYVTSVGHLYSSLVSQNVRQWRE